MNKGVKIFLGLACLVPAPAAKATTLCYDVTKCTAANSVTVKSWGKMFWIVDDSHGGESGRKGWAFHNSTWAVGISPDGGQHIAIYNKKNGKVGVSKPIDPSYRKFILVPDEALPEKGKALAGIIGYAISDTSLLVIDFSTVYRTDQDIYDVRDRAAYVAEIPLLKFNSDAIDEFTFTNDNGKELLILRGNGVELKKFDVTNPFAPKSPLTQPAL